VKESRIDSIAPRSHNYPGVDELASVPELASASFGQPRILAAAEAALGKPAVIGQWGALLTLPGDRGTAGTTTPPPPPRGAVLAPTQPDMQSPSILRPESYRHGGVAWRRRALRLQAAACRRLLRALLLFNHSLHRLPGSGSPDFLVFSIIARFPPVAG
jgi:hypothetical protein